MLRNFGGISFAFAAVFLALLVWTLLHRLQKKSLKSRKKLKALRRLYLSATAVFTVLGLTLTLADLAGEKKIGLLQTDFSPVERYQSLAKDVEKAYPTLPAEIFAIGDDYYFRTGENALYAYREKEVTQKNDKGEEIKTVVYEKGLFGENYKMVAGEQDFLAVLNQKKQLRLQGAFEYLKYEKDNTFFENELYGRACTFVAANENNLFYVDGGHLYSAGYNSFGQLGDGTERNRVKGVKILENVATVSVSETHVLAVDDYGNLYGFGDNSYSEMGNRTTASSITPIKLMSGVKQAKAGRYFSIVLTKNGDVFVAGRNHLGQLGTGDSREYASYTRILEGIDKIAVHADSCAALTAAGELYVWGNNKDRQLGSGEDVLLTPVCITKEVYDMDLGHSSMGIIKHNRDIYVSGTARPVNNNEYFQAVYQFNATVPQDRVTRTNVVMPTPLP